MRRCAPCLLCGVALLACGSETPSDAAAGTVPDAGSDADAASEPGVVLRLRLRADGAAPVYGDVPMPNDAWLGADGHLEKIAGLEALTPTRADSFAEHIARLDGFGVRPTLELFAEGDLDADSIPEKTTTATDALLLIDIDVASPADGAVLAVDWRWDAARRRIAGSPEPGVVLRSGGRYAVVVTSDVKDATGLAVSRDAGLESIAAKGPSGVPERWRSTAEAFAKVAKLPQLDGGARIRGFAAFTVQRATRVLPAARALHDDLGAFPAPAIAFDDPTLVFDSAAKLEALLGTAERDANGDERWGWSNPTGIAHDHVGVIATGTLGVPRFTRDDTGDDGPDDETFDIDPATGAPTPIDPHHAIPVTLALPKAAPSKATGYPVAIFGHGLGASRHAILTFVEPLTRAGFAVVAIDFAGHGSRFDPTDQKNNSAAVIASFSGDALLHDGFGDVTGLGTTLDLFEGFLNLSAVRDSIQQSVLDLSGLVRALEAPGLDLSPLGGAYTGAAPKLDVARVAYLGESFGTIVGGVFAAIEPDVDLYVLDVPGGGIVDLEIASSPGLGTLVIPLARSIYGFEGRFDRFHPLVSLTQALLDPADPLTWAPHVLKDRVSVGGTPNGKRHLVQIEVVGDEIMANIGTDAVARALGVQLLSPSLNAVDGVDAVASPASANVDGQTAVQVQYSPATHGANWTSESGDLQFLPGFPAEGDDAFPKLPKPITITNPIHETLDQVVEILTTHQATGVPVVTSTLAPVADFDDDGMSDADEIAAGRNPYDPNG